MLTHAQIWAAIDALAEQQGLTPSSLARRAGLDPTTFNRSKRMKPDGNPRWPSTESIAKILNATGISVDHFVSFVPGAGKNHHQIPLHVMSDHLGDAFDARHAPLSVGWTEIAFPDPYEVGAFALEIRGDQYLPIYRPGDIVIVAPQTPTRRGDRVFVLEKNGAASIAMLGHQQQATTLFTSLSGNPLPQKSGDSIAMIARIIWASQ